MELYKKKDLYQITDIMCPQDFYFCTSSQFNK